MRVGSPRVTRNLGFSGGVTRRSTASLGASTTTGAFGGVHIFYVLLAGAPMRRWRNAAWSDFWLTDAASVRLLVDMTVAAMLSISLLARWLTKSLRILTLSATVILHDCCFQVVPGWASRTPASTKQAADTEAGDREATRRVLAGRIAIVALLSDD
jgi:hypothetical protein